MTPERELQILWCSHNLAQDNVDKIYNAMLECWQHHGGCQPYDIPTLDEFRKAWVNIWKQADKTLRPEGRHTQRSVSMKP